MLLRAVSEFIVTTRIPWDARDDSLRDHVDAVVDALKECAPVRDVTVEADLERSAATLVVVAHVPRDRRGPGDEVRRLIGGAINRSGGLHEHLLPIAEEAQQKPERNTWWGLLTPRWSARSVRIDEEEENA